MPTHCLLESFVVIKSTRRERCQKAYGKCIAWTYIHECKVAILSDRINCTTIEYTVHTLHTVQDHPYKIFVFELKYRKWNSKKITRPLIQNPCASFGWCILQFATSLILVNDQLINMVVVRFLNVGT